MNVPDTMTTRIPLVCVCRPAVVPGGNLISIPYAPLLWSPQRSTTLTPGGPGVMSAHFRSAAGHMTALLAAAFGAFFAFASHEPCARTAAASRNDTTNARTFLPFITDLLFRFRCCSDATTRPECRQAGTCLLPPAMVAE